MQFETGKGNSELDRFLSQGPRVAFFPEGRASTGDARVETSGASVATPFKLGEAIEDSCIEVPWSGTYTPVGAIA